ncbi:MAG TPA: hypothetical protein PK264_07395 [Hyphomicrobiaceae bacterium]|nr:hypothetical protein [Hyphomicrobiaceae bacterium]
MAQAWLQVMGLFLDVMGFGLIAWEWLMAQRAERALLAIEGRRRAEEERQRMMRRHDPNMHPSMQVHMEMVDQMSRRTTAAALETTRTTFSGRRYALVYTGMVFVLAGFILQLAGAWPGCCDFVGITPGAN